MFFKEIRGYSRMWRNHLSLPPHLAAASLENKISLIQSGKLVSIFKLHAGAGRSEPIQVAKEHSLRLVW